MVGGIPTVRLSRSQMAALMVEDSLQQYRSAPHFPKLVFSSNGSVIARYHLDAEFQALVKQAHIIDADGMPLVIASRMFCQRPLVERVATTDFIHDASEAAAGKGIKFYFLGGQPGVAEIAADSLREKYEGLQIVGTRSGYFTADEEADICAEIQDKGTDVLWLGLGSPIQEQFAVRNSERLSRVAWIKTCGGLFDHFVGHTTRAPQWMQKAGLEWLSRTLQEPRRLAPRYFWSNPVATYFLLTQTYDPPASSQVATTS